MGLGREQEAHQRVLIIGHAHQVEVRCLLHLVHGAAGPARNRVGWLHLLQGIAWRQLLSEHAQGLVDARRERLDEDVLGADRGETGDLGGGVLFEALEGHADDVEGQVIALVSVVRLREPRQERGQDAEEIPDRFRLVDECAPGL